MAVIAFLRKHLNPLSLLASVLLLISVWLIAFPGPEGWGILGGIGFFFLFGLPTFVTNTFVIWATRPGKIRLITQVICLLVILSVFTWFWFT